MNFPWVFACLAQTAVLWMNKTYPGRCWAIKHREQVVQNPCDIS